MGQQKTFVKSRKTHAMLVFSTWQVTMQALWFCFNYAELIFDWRASTEVPGVFRSGKLEGCPSDSWHGRWHHASIPPGYVHITHLRGKVERRLPNSWPLSSCRRFASQSNSEHIFAQSATTSTSPSFPLHIDRTEPYNMHLASTHTHTLIQTLTHLVSARI